MTKPVDFTTIERSTNMSPALAAASIRRSKVFAVIAVLSWFLLALGCSVFGVFDSQDQPPLTLGAAAIVPVLVFGIGYLRSDAFRQFVLGANPRLLVLAQTWRIGGVVFLILHHRGLLPGVFALPAGWGDIAIGATAPLVAWAMGSRRGLPTPVFVTWHMLGMLDLVMAVTLGILASASPVGILAGDVTTALMGTFPLSLIPTFFVPLLLILHLIALGQVHQRRGQPAPRHSLHPA
jgi:hypothetical protein